MGVVVGVLAPGTSINGGSFIIDALLAGGGFGEVYLASQPAMFRKVAVKVLRPEVSRNPRVLTLFEREARAAGALLHPNVLPVIDFGYDEGAGVHYLAMHYVPEGRTLKDVLGAPLPLAEVSRYVDAIASALDAAHAAGIVHRDVKPANVLLDPSQRPLLTDFGIAHLSTAATETGTGVRVGTALYMAPERWISEPADAKGDQYALAAMTFELLGGQPPFRGDEFALLGQHLTSPPPSLLPLNSEVTPAIDAVVSRGLSKSKEDRFGSCGEFARALGDAIEAARLAAINARYEHAVRLREAGDYDSAIRELEGIRRQRPGFRDVEALLEDTARGLAAGRMHVHSAAMLAPAGHDPAEVSHTVISPPRELALPPLPATGAAVADVRTRAAAQASARSHAWPSFDFAAAVRASQRLATECACLARRAAGLARMTGATGVRTAATGAAGIVAFVMAHEVIAAVATGLTLTAAAVGLVIVPGRGDARLQDEPAGAAAPSVPGDVAGAGGSPVSAPALGNAAELSADEQQAESGLTHELTFPLTQGEADALQDDVLADTTPLDPDDAEWADDGGELAADVLADEEDADVDAAAGDEGDGDDDADDAMDDANDGLDGI